MMGSQAIKTEGQDRASRLDSSILKLHVGTLEISQLQITITSALEKIVFLRE